ASDEIDGLCFDIIGAIRESGFDADPSWERVKEIVPGAGDGLEDVVRYICGFIHGAVCRMTDEVDNILSALQCEFVPPRPSGCPGRGRANILPTGRNFYSIDPDGIPWHSSWEIGSAMAEQMVERYVEDKGGYPKSIGVVLWATDTMKTGGDDVSYILKLMGLRPVWDGYGGRVKDLEVIPTSELGRPRLDVTLRISGLFRDTFPNLCRLIDDGVNIIASLDEDEETNYLAANLRRDLVEALAQGIPMDRARRDASIRIFGDAPGQYGCGISELVTTGNWKTVGDLGETYIKHGCYVYGRGLEGEARPELFRNRLSTIDVTVKNHNTRAVDMLDMDDDFDCLGGFTAAVTAVRGEAPVSFMGDSSDMENLRLRTTQEECRFIFRSKIDNPKWLDGLKQHGFAGAKELSKLFDYTMGWSATSDIVENWMYDDLAERFVLDEETSEWIKDENPYAMMAMLARLQEAISRGFWDADEEMQERLRDKYLEFEERIEEITDQ
ncbi:MAG: cobaltochelatase subunit CobN, partial [Candidatus Methanomethylophilaceae archaeon]|nr:cobaltochelatase subunit CobN [Candidatus Methanomethylophilaceae archaeon]